MQFISYHFSAFAVSYNKGIHLVVEYYLNVSGICHMSPFSIIIFEWFPLVLIKPKNLFFLSQNTHSTNLNEYLQRYNQEKTDLKYPNCSKKKTVRPFTVGKLSVDVMHVSRVFNLLVNKIIYFPEIKTRTATRTQRHQCTQK